MNRDKAAKQMNNKGKWMVRLYNEFINEYILTNEKIGVFDTRPEILQTMADTLNRAEEMEKEIERLKEEKKAAFYDNYGKCTLTNEELIKACDNWVSKFISLIVQTLKFR